MKSVVKSQEDNVCKVCIPCLGCRYSVSVTILVLPHKAASAGLWAETGLPINWRGPVSAVWSHTEVSNPSCTNPSNVQRQLSCPLCVLLHRSVFSFLPWSSYFPQFPDPLSSRSLPFVNICQCLSKNTAGRTEGKALNLVSPAQRTMGQWPWSGSREKAKLSLARAGGSLLLNGGLMVCNQLKGFPMTPPSPSPAYLPS